MRVMDRVLLVVLFLALLAKSVLTMAIGLGWNPGIWLAEAGRTLVLHYRAETFVVGLAELVIAYYLGSWAVRRRLRDKTIVKETSLGTVRISLRAVDTLVQRAARQVQGVRDVQSGLRVDKHGLEINLTLTVAPDLNMPAVSDEVQHRIERYIGETVGVTPSKVQIVFQSVGTDSKARVE